MTIILLRLVSARAPYFRGGLSFEATADRSYGLVIVALAAVADAQVDELLADPHVDVAVGVDGHPLFMPVADRAAFDAALAMIAGEPLPVTGDPAIASALDAAADAVARYLAANPGVTIEQLLGGAGNPDPDETRLATEQGRDTAGPHGDEAAPAGEPKADAKPKPAARPKPVKHHQV